MTETNLTPATRPVRICVVGCGHWGKNLARNFAALGHLHGLCESDPARLNAFGSQYKPERTYLKPEEAFADPDVEAVVIATPAETHHPLALAALQAGKDVFVEKPLTLDWRSGQEMVDRAAACGRILMVGHLLRYHPAVLQLEKLIEDGVLGRIEYIYSNRLSMGKIRREENALWSFAPHDISVILQLTGQLPIQVTATGGAYLQPNIADVTVSNLLFDHGVRAHIFVSWLHPYKEQRLVLIGSKQMAVFEDSRPDHKLMLFDKRIELKDGVLEAGKPNGIPVEFPNVEPLKAECEHFAAAVASRTRPRTPGEEGVAVLSVLQACQRSIQMNGQPVSVEPMSAQRLATL